MLLLTLIAWFMWFLYCKVTIFPCVTNKYLGEKPCNFANPISPQISATNFRVRQWVSFATISISVDSRIFILVSGSCGVLLILSLKLFQLWSLGAPSSWLLSFSNFLPFFFFYTFYLHKMFLTFYHHKLFQVRLLCHFIVFRLVRVSKNYRSVIRACLEEMHQLASKDFVCLYVIIVEGFIWL